MQHQVHSIALREPSSQNSLTSPSKTTGVGGKRTKVRGVDRVQRESSIRPQKERERSKCLSTTFLALLMPTKKASQKVLFLIKKNYNILFYFNVMLLVVESVLWDEHTKQTVLVPSEGLLWGSSPVTSFFPSFNLVFLSLTSSLCADCLTLPNHVDHVRLFSICLYTRLRKGVDCCSRVCCV